MPGAPSMGDRTGLGSIGSMTGSENPTGPLEPSDALRIGTAERERAVALLNDAVGAGYLDLREFEERSGQVFAARTRGDLRPILADLPTAEGLFPPAFSSAVGPVGPAPPAAAPQTIDIDWTTVKRRGAWPVPPMLVVSGSMGTADLDFSRAPLPAAGCVLDVYASWSTVKITVDSSTGVRSTDWEGGSMSTLKDKAGPPTAPGGPTLHVRGRSSWTTIVLRRR